MSGLPLIGIPRDLATHVSVVAAIELVRWKGGRRLWVPAQLRRGHVIERHLGLPAYQWLVDRFPCQVIAVSKCSSALIRCRDAEMVTAHAAGRSICELATDYGLSMRAISSAIRRGRSDTAAANPQPDLFEPLRAAPRRR